jgi:hypothetical protein
MHTRRLTVRQLPQLLDALARDVLADDISNRQVPVRGWAGKREEERAGVGKRERGKALWKWLEMLEPSFAKRAGSN